MRNYERKYSINLAACLLAVFAMFTGSISACACDHHQPLVAYDASSCHSQKATVDHNDGRHGAADEASGNTQHLTTQNHNSSHEPAANSETQDGSHFGESCDCSAQVQQPTIQAKSDDAKTKFAKRPMVAVAVEPFEPAKIIADDASVFCDRLEHFYSSKRSGSRSSRAPPRL